MPNTVYYERVNENPELMANWMNTLSYEQFDEIKTNIPGYPLYGNIISLEPVNITQQQLLTDCIPLKMYLYGTRYKGIVNNLYFDRNWSVWNNKIYPAFMIKGEVSWQLGEQNVDVNGSLVNYDPGHQIYYIVGPTNTVYKIVAKPANGSLVLKPKTVSPPTVIVTDPPIIIVDDNGGTTIIDEPPRLGSGQIYCPVDPADIINNISERTSTGLWSENLSYLPELYNEYIDKYIDSSVIIEPNNLDYELVVQNKKYTEDCINNQFTIYYANYNGGGSKDLLGFDDETLTKAMYSQFVNLLLPKGQNKFKFNDVESDDIYVIKVNRDRFKDYFDLGNWQLSLSKINVSEINGYNNDSDISTITLNAPSIQLNNVITLIDETRLSDNLDKKLNRSFRLIYGNLEDTNINESNVQYFPGYVYPHYGIIVLSAPELDNLLNFKTNRNIERHGCNTVRLFNSIQNVTKNNWTDGSGDALGFRARNINYRNSKIVFIRKKNGQLTYSNNPTYVKNKDGEIIQPFLGIEKSYFTTVGLFNSEKTLLAIGKLSKPILSTTVDESLLTVKVSI